MPCQMNEELRKEFRLLLMNEGRLLVSYLRCVKCWEASIF